MEKEWRKKEDAVLISLVNQGVPIDLMVKYNVFKGRTKIEIYKRLKFLKEEAKK